jgi:hypothetical protein
VYEDSLVSSVIVMLADMFYEDFLLVLSVIAMLADMSLKNSVAPSIFAIPTATGAAVVYVRQAVMTGVSILLKGLIRWHGLSRLE